MTNLLMVLGVLFAALFVLTKLLEGRAKPLTGEQQQRLSRWIMIALAVSLLLSLLHHYMG
jgi:hypothetical protein